MKWLIFSFVVIFFSRCGINTAKTPDHISFLDSLDVLDEFTFPDLPIEQLKPSVFQQKDSSLFEFLAFQIENFSNRTGFYYRCFIRDTLIIETLPFDNLSLNQDVFNRDGALLRIHHDDPAFAEISARDGTAWKFNFELHECFPAWLEVPTFTVVDGWLIPVRAHNLGLNPESYLTDSYKNARPVLFLSVNDSLEYRFFGAYPKSYTEQGVYGYDLHPFLAQDNRDNIILSFPGSAEILIGFVNGNEYMEISAKSYFDVGYTPMNRDDYMVISKAIKFQIETPKYRNILHNKWNNQTYRIYRLPKGQMFNSREVTHSMIVLNQEFRILREFVFDGSVYSPEHFVPHPEGLMVLKNVKIQANDKEGKLMILRMPG